MSEKHWIQLNRIVEITVFSKKTKKIMQILFAHDLCDCIGDINVPFTIYINRTRKTLNCRFTTEGS